MKRSKLELYEDVILALSNRSLSVDAIAYSCKMDCIGVRQRLDFLLRNGIVQERIFNAGTRYSLTRRGVAVLKTIVITRRLQKLQNRIKIIDDSVHMVPAFSEFKEKKAERNK